ncbi:MAG: ribosome silencing factor [Polyangiales bacterium]
MTAATKPAAKKTTAAAKPAAKTSTAATKPAAKKTTAAAKPAAKKSTAATKPAAKKTPAKKASAKKPAAVEVVTTAAPVVPVAPPVPLDGQQIRREAAKALAKAVAAAGLDKKAERVEIIDITEKVDYADFLVLMSGRSDRQAQAIAGGIEEVLKQQGHRPLSVEGASPGHWVIVDYGDVIVHVFQDEARRYYDLDSLWLDARRVPLESAPRASVPPPA